MNNQWIKEATNEELFEQYAISMNELSKAVMFSAAYMECKKELNMIKEEMLNRMK